jgi:hypothetical protein
MEEMVTITIGKADVLFELFADFRDQATLTIQNASDRYALWAFEGCLEKTLVEPFMPNYGEIVDNARKQLVDRYSPAE